jgi:peptidoglycan hydrolase CwlO-like protein
MSYDILINNLVNGEKITITNPDGTTYQEPRPPNRTALAAAKAIQNLQNQLNFSVSSINQLTKERNEMWEVLEKTQEQNKKLQDEIKSLQSTKTGE